MHFLKKHIRYYFTESVILRKTKYNYHVECISDVDIVLLNKVLGTVAPAMKVQGTDAYINGREIKFINKNITPEVPIAFDEVLFWRLAIVIQGYKKTPTGRPTPIWKIVEAHQAL
jgi:hypothetical protein